MKRKSANAERFILKSSYLGAAGIIDNERKYRGLFYYGQSKGSLWVGVTQHPLKKMFDNFMVLSTDYENYAIIYQCVSKSVMYNKDIVNILVRDPDLSKLQSGTEEKIKQEFKRLFGKKEKELPDAEKKEQDVNATDFEVFKDDKEVIVSNGKKTKKTDEKEEVVGKDKGRNFGRYKSKPSKMAGLPLEFNTHLKQVDHSECLPDYYPDLSISREQRQSIERRQNKSQKEAARLEKV